MKKLLYCAGAAAGALALFFVHRWTLERQERRLDERYRAFTEETAAAVRSMSGKRVAPPVLANASRFRSVTIPSGLAAEDPAPESTEHQATRESDDSAARAEDQAAYVDSVFETEGQDAAWARETRGTLERLLLERVGTSRLESLECRKTMCRARVVHQDEAGFQGFISSVFSPPTLWSGAVMSMKDAETPGGRVSSTMFFGRDQLELPRLD